MAALDRRVRLAQGQIAELIVTANKVIMAIAADLRCDIVVGQIVGLNRRMDAVVVAIDLIDDTVRAGREGWKFGVDAGVLDEIGDVGRDISLAG